MKRVQIGDCVLYCGDCLEVMPTLETHAVDMVLADLPYGTTACKWDTVIPFVPLWECYKHVTKRNAAIVLTASQPFTSRLVMSNPKWFRYEWIWDKVKPSGFQNVSHRPLTQHETALVFAKATPNYYPIKTPRHCRKVRGKLNTIPTHLRNFQDDGLVRVYDDRFPKTIVSISNAKQHGKVHSTQKPVALGEYLIKTYTNEGETVLDNTMGSGSFGVACVNTNRKFIGIELDETYFDIAVDRITEAYRKKAEELPLSA
jgi:DNA modification methylase